MTIVEKDLVECVDCACLNLPFAPLQRVLGCQFPVCNLK